MPDFLFNALVVGSMIAMMAGPLGCFVVWRRMAYFGAAIAHSALLGVALAFVLGGLLLSLAGPVDSLGHQVGQLLVDDPWPVVLLLSLLIAVALLYLQRRQLLANDTLLGIVAHGSLAIGLLMVAAMESLRIDIMSYLFGDILSIDSTDMWLQTALGLCVIAILIHQWRPLLSNTVNPELAAVEGVRTRRTELVFVLMLAFVVALGMRIVGVLLIISMLIIPPATARRLVGSAHHMAIVSSVIGVLDVWLGLALAWHFDWPAGPAIVSVSMLFFILVMLFPRQPV